MSDSYLTPGSAVGHYRIVERLGAGGMGEVYVATDPDLDRQVALKFLAPHLAADDSCRSRFTREARAAAALSHPNIIHIYEVSEHEGRPFLAMELVDGRALSDVIAGGELAFSDVLETAVQICDGLGEAHEAGIVHRDIKPSNILADSKGRVRLVDFGLATHKKDRKLTTTGSTVGTLAYMSPEQALGREVDRRSDLFSLGVVVYEMVAGRSPFDAAYDAEVLYATVNADPEPLARYRANVPEGLQQVVSKLLEKDPALRYQTAGEVAADLRRIMRDHGLGGSGVVVRRQAPTRPRWRSTVRVAGVALAVFAVVVLALKVGRLSVFGGQDDEGERALAVLYFDNLKDPADTTRMGQIIQELVITDLSELPSVDVLSSQRLFDVQKTLGYPDRRRIDPDIATEVARRAGANIMLSGNLMQLDEKWIINCHLIDVDKGTIIKSQKIDGRDLYDMVDDIAGRVRADLSLPVDSSDRVDVAVGEKTTTSIEAYRHYLAGVDFLNIGSLAPAIARFKKAIDVDPAFNQAHYKLALAQWWSRDVDSEEGQASIRRILENRYYSSERERLLALGGLALTERRFTDALAIYRPLADTYPDDKEVQFALGLAYSLESTLNRDEALAAFRRVIELDLTFVLAYRELFDLYAGERDYARAMEMARDLITIRPDGLMGYRFLVEAALLRGDTTQINLALDQALQHHKTDEELKGLYLHMGLVGNRLRDEEMSEKYTRMALAFDPDTTDWQVMAQLGDALFNQRKIDEARRAWQKGLELSPTDTWCLGGLWYVACAARRWEDAIEYAEELVKMRPQSPRRHGELYESYAFMLRPDDADRALEEGLSAIPSVSGKVQLLGHASHIAWLALHDSHRQEELLLRAATLDPSGEALSSETSVNIYTSIAEIHLRRRDYDRAEHFARRTLQIEPDGLSATSVLFRCHLYRGEYEKALALAARFIGRNPGVSRSYESTIETLIAAGRYAEADSVLEVALDVDPMPTARARTLVVAAERYLGEGEFLRAERLSERARAYSPEDVIVIENMGRVYELRGRFRDAEQAYRELQPVPLAELRSGDEHYSGLLHMAGLALRQGQYDRAERWLHKALQIDPSSPEALRLEAHYWCEKRDYTRALGSAERALEIDRSFFSTAQVAWVLTEGGIDIDHGIDLAQQALEHPPETDITDDYILLNPFVPLPHHILGIAYLKKGELDRATSHLRKAGEQRPQDPRIAKDLEIAQHRSSG